MTLRICVWLALFAGAAAARDGCALSGVIVAENGRPVPGAVVRAWRSDGLIRSPAIGTVSDNQGHFCLKAAPAGRYSIAASARTQTPSSSPRCEECCRPAKEFAPTMYPAKLPANSDTGIKIVLGMIPAFCVRGEVRSRTGVLPPHFTISVAEPDGEALYSILHENGRFLLTAFPSGDYIIEVWRFGKPGFQAPLTRQRIAIKGNMDRLTVWIP
ncbi:MAG: carboxypeptidase regulatory-like domain-containing protein [Acidobacteriaceae bacterium]|nr:carboxypeptidase regulatory-like domain-containing protein [Acidobacteriaceae bacterium]